jgi:hypothetical protein
LARVAHFADVALWVIYAAMSAIMVRAAWDDDARVWWTESSDLDGLSIEAESLDQLIERLPAVVSDLLEAGGDQPVTPTKSRNA